MSPGWNQKTSEWDYDIAFTYLYQYGDPALGVGRNYVIEPDCEGLSVQQRRRLFQSGDRPAVRRRRGRLPPIPKRQEIYAKAQKDPDRRRAGGVAARTAVPHHHPLQTSRTFVTNKRSASMTASATPWIEK